MPTLGEKLGIEARPSRLLEKAKALGLDSPEKLEALGVARGCSHYFHDQMAATPDVPEKEFTNEELAIALLSPNLPYSPHSIRVGAAMLSAADNDPKALGRLAVGEEAVIPARYIATSALKFEPENPFWPALLGNLPDAPDAPDGVMPHPTRFVSMWGMMRGKVGRWVVWLRPRPTAPLANG